MPNSVTSPPNNAVATLMYNCGVSVNMNYGPCESGSNLPKTDSAYKKYFGYSPKTHYIQKDLYPNQYDWADTLIAELDAGRPIQYAGFASNGDGHTFVCNGYQGTDLFYFNWGWSGSQDGYYYLNWGILNWIPYHNHQMAIIGIQPGALIELNSTITPSINPLEQNQSAIISVTLSNIGQADFNGYLYAKLYNMQNQFICNLDSGYATLITGHTYNINFTPSSINAAPGNYKIFIRYKPDGFNDYITAAKGNYSNPIDIQVVTGPSNNTLDLFSDITVSPYPMVQYQMLI